MRKTLLLIGGGHTHLHILKKLQSENILNVKVILVSPSFFQYYSGMVSGYAEGLYALDEIRVDLQRLSQLGRVEFIEDRAVFLDPLNQIVHTQQGLALKYDVVSFDIGSRTAHPTIPGIAENEIMVKPMDQFVKAVQTFDRAQHIAVVGGGASGIEVSLAIQARRRKLGMLTPVSLVSAGLLMEKSGHYVSRKITEIVQQKGIRLYQNDGVVQASSNRMYLQSGNHVTSDQLLWLTGPQAPSLFSKSGMKVDEHGYLAVYSTLQSVEYPNIFGAGDCISFAEYPNLAKAGVYAVREAPILWRNLKRYFSGNQMIQYHPQNKYLSILSAGNREAFLLYGSIALHGTWCWKLKRKIDKAFMNKYK
ncbi:FAD-dependent oxidoreductase [Aneurinibacillus sp. Ricciae_BoGa-3]|nr:FAD-dependent oxidoreductase [Aneurinibacillus sp. Ricciae_BoGa-3]WCK52953.1 FAD-dependent oxidoreductase [Aneurinibacillus sp. Ricciae_BoGa-3]